MKKIIFFAILNYLCLPLFASGQVTDSSYKKTGTGDISMYANIIHGEVRPIFWGTYQFPNKVFVDVRYNFDWVASTGTFIGYTFSIGKQWVTPEVGMLFGEYNSFSPEIIAGGDVGRINWFLFNQYSLAIDEDPNFFYQYGQCLLKIDKEIKVGFAVQNYIEGKSSLEEVKKDVYTDIGFVVLLSVSKYYFKPWYTFDPWHDYSQKAIIGVGRTF
jgi:hypothetical protein